MKGRYIIMKEMSRREARIKAFEIIFMIDTCEIDYELLRLQEELASHRKHFNYIKSVVTKAVENLDLVDEKINECLADGWSLNRLSKMSRGILRLAISEIMFMDDIPNNVSINEAVEIAKIYCDDNEPSFINGLLAKVVK